MTDALTQPQLRRPSRRLAPVAASAVLVVVALVSRFYCLGEWSISDDEIYTVYHAFPRSEASRTPTVGVFPVSYVLTRFSSELLSPFGSLSWEFRLRFLHAVAGVLAILAFPWLVRRESGSTVALILSALVCFLPWHLFQSQFIRYYAALFLLVGITGVLYRAAMKSGSRRGWVAVAVFSALSILTHPTAVLLLAVMFLDAVANRGLLRSPRGRAVLASISLSVLAILALFTLWRWSDVRGSVVWSLGLKKETSEDWIDVVQGFVYNLGAHVALLAVLAIPMSWRKDRALTLYLVLWAGVPLATVLVLSLFGVPVGERYLIISIPPCLWLVAIGLGEIAAAVGRNDRLAGAALPVVVVLLYLPSFFSHYQDGNRHDYRGVAQFLKAEAGPRDLIIAEAHSLIARYANWPDDRVVEAPPGDWSWRAAERAEELWVVIPDTFTRAPGWTGMFTRWAMQHCRIAAVFYRPRLDYHQNRLWVLHRSKAP
ncbi:MAG: glycosyltransferase family 39 protein [Planctomycetota bacterium]